MVILVTGGNGQLGQALALVAENHPALEFYFANSSEGDITNKKGLTTLFFQVRPRFCINAAAYTAVDKAESDQEKAHLVNSEGAKTLAEVCAEFGTTLLHISTDFVFDGNHSTPYTEEDATNPQGTYGLTKRDGELAIIDALKEYFIIRTSWLYSEFGTNFMKTMIRVAGERPAINVVDDQKGTPTYAVDLADVLIRIILSGKKEFGIYHFSNEGETTWFGFAREIFKLSNISTDLRPIATSEYPTPAKRPAYSVLDKSKIKDVFGIKIKEWQESLAECLQKREM